MDRFNKSILAALLGLVLIGAGTGKEPSSKEISTQAESQDRSIKSGSKSSNSPSSVPIEMLNPQNKDELTVPCEKDVDRRQSDLCAQWKAAGAADRAAWWAMIGTIVALLGSTGLYWQIHLSRKAVEETSLATKAMAKANEIAVAAQRPWLSIHVEPTVLKLQGKALRCEINIHVNNLGQSVANNYCFLFDLTYTRDGNPNYVDQIWKGFEEKKVKNRSLVIPGDVEVFKFWSYKNIDFIDGYDTAINDNGGVLARFAVSAFYQSDVTGDKWLQIDKVWWIAHRTYEGNVLTKIDKNFTGAEPNMLSAEPLVAATLGH